MSICGGYTLNSRTTAGTTTKVMEQGNTVTPSGSSGFANTIGRVSISFPTAWHRKYLISRINIGHGLFHLKAKSANFSKAFSYEDRLIPGTIDDSRRQDTPDTPVDDDVYHLPEFFVDHFRIGVFFHGEHYRLTGVGSLI